MKRRRESSSSSIDSSRRSAAEDEPSTVVAEEQGAAGSSSGTSDDASASSAAALPSIDADVNVNVDAGPFNPDSYTTRTTSTSSAAGLLPVAEILTDFGNHPTRFRPRWEWYSAPKLPQKGVTVSLPAESSTTAAVPTLSWVLPKSPHEVDRRTPSQIVLTRPQTLFGRDWDTALHLCIREGKIDAALVLIDRYCAPGVMAIINPEGYEDWPSTDRKPAPVATPTTPTPSPGTATEHRRAPSPAMGVPPSPKQTSVGRFRATGHEIPCSIDVPNAHGITALMVAAQRGDDIVARALLRHGSDPTRQSSNGDTAALKAAHFGHLHLVRQLVAGWDCGRSMPQTPCWVQSVATPQFLQMSNARGTSPLMRAAQEGHMDVVQYLLDQGVDVDQTNLHQMTALLLAAQRGHANVCELLLRYGANCHATNTPQNSTGLLLACRRRHIDVVRVLVRAGAILYHRDARGRTAKQLATNREGTWRDNDRRTLLRWLDPQHQIYVWQVESRKRRNWALCRLWLLLQQERAYCRTDDDEDDDGNEEDDDEDDNTNRNNDNEGEINDGATVGEESESASTPLERSTSASISIHQVQQYLDAEPGSWPLSMDRPLDRSAIIGCYFQSTTPCRKALLRTLSMLPAPLVQNVAEFLPLPHLWARRLGQLSRAALVNPEATLLSALDLIDEALEEIGLIEAFAAARVPPPRGFASWAVWKRHVRLHGDVSASTSCRPSPEGASGTMTTMALPPRLDVTTAEVPPPGDPQAPCAIELRRTVGYLALVARHPAVPEVLIGPAWCMPANLVTRLSTVSDLSQLSRRTMIIAAEASDGSGPFDGLAAYGDSSRRSSAGGSISVDPSVALDVIMLASQLCNWCGRERSLRLDPPCLGRDE